MKRVHVELRDPSGVLIQCRTFDANDREELAEFVGDFVFLQGVDPDGPEDDVGLSGAVEFTPVRGGTR